MIKENIKRFAIQLRLFPTKLKNFFPLIHFVRGGKSGRFCTSGTELCVEGFESSANTFAFNVLYCVNPDLNFARHKHVVANLKRAVDYEVPTVILFRDPDDCIPSAVARFRPSLCEAIQRYLMFYRYVIEEMEPDVLLVSFEDMTQETVPTVQRISSFANLDIDTDHLNQVEERAKNRIRRRTRQRSNTTEQISLPREKREQKKKEVRDKLIQHPNYIEAKHLYYQLQSIHNSQL